MNKTSHSCERIAVDTERGEVLTDAGAWADLGNLTLNDKEPCAEDWTDISIPMKAQSSSL